MIGTKTVVLLALIGFHIQTAAFSRHRLGVCADELYFDPRVPEVPGKVPSGLAGHAMESGNNRRRLWGGFFFVCCRVIGVVRFPDSTPAASGG
jgi:hypothetical protein